MGHTGLGRVLNSRRVLLEKEKNTQRHRHRQQGPVKMEAGNGVMLPQAKECRKP